MHGETSYWWILVCKHLRLRAFAKKYVMQQAGIYIFELIQYLKGGITLQLNFIPNMELLYFFLPNAAVPKKL